MRLLAVRQARVIWTVPIEELNPEGKALLPLLLSGLEERYGFTLKNLKPPSESEAVVLENGSWNNIAIDSVTIFPQFLAIDTSSNTRNSESFFDDAIDWAVKSVGIVWSPTMITKKAYLSELIVHQEHPLNGMNPAFEGFGKSVSKSLKKYTGASVDYETAGISFHYDHAESRTSYSPFRIERLDEATYSKNKYYSSAPLPTDEHLRLIEEFESLIA